MRSATATRKHLIRQTPLPEAGAVVVTCRYADGGWETRIEGGRLDGRTLPAWTAAEARTTHEGALRLVREAAAA